LNKHYTGAQCTRAINVNLFKNVNLFTQTNSLHK